MTSQATLFKLSKLKFHPGTIHSKRPLHFEALKIRNGKMTRESKSKAFLKMFSDLFLCVVYWIFAILDTATNGFDQFTNKPSALLSRR